MTLINLGTSPVAGQLLFFNHTACVIPLVPEEGVDTFPPGTTAEVHIYGGSNEDAAVYEGVLAGDLSKIIITIPDDAVSEHIEEGARTFGLIFDGAGAITGKIRFFSGKAGDKNVREIL